MVDDHVTVVAGVDTAATGRDSAPADPDSRGSALRDTGSAPVPVRGVERPWHGMRTTETDRGVCRKGKRSGELIHREISAALSSADRGDGPGSVPATTSSSVTASASSGKLSLSQRSVLSLHVPGRALSVPCRPGALALCLLLMLSAPRPLSVVVTSAPLLVDTDTAALSLVEQIAPGKNKKFSKALVRLGTGGEIVPKLCVQGGTLLKGEPKPRMRNGPTYARTYGGQLPGLLTSSNQLNVIT